MKQEVLDGMLFLLISIIVDSEKQRNRVRKREDIRKHRLY